MPLSTSFAPLLSTLCLYLLALPSLSSASAVVSPPPIAPGRRGPAVSPSALHGIERRNSLGYNDPRTDGGQMLTIIAETYPAGLGEPLNIILSGNSDSAVLVDSEADGGFRNYWLSLNFSSECLNVYNPGGQQANLGDGQGTLNQTAELRYNFGDYYFGTCLETFNGGNHFRYWTQKNTGAYFIAASLEQNLAAGHDIVRNGYDTGRDAIVSYATYGNNSITLPTLNMTNQSTFSGSTTYNNYTYATQVNYVSNLLSNSSDGINHYLTVEEGGRPAIDGLVAVLTVKISKYPDGVKASSSAFQTFAAPISTLLLLVSALTLLSALF